MYRQNAHNLVKIEDFIPILQNSATDVNEESLAASKFFNCELVLVHVVQFCPEFLKPLSQINTSCI